MNRSGFIKTVFALPAAIKAAAMKADPGYRVIYSKLDGGTACPDIEYGDPREDHTYEVEFDTYVVNDEERQCHEVLIGGRKHYFTRYNHQDGSSTIEIRSFAPWQNG